MKLSKSGGNWVCLLLIRLSVSGSLRQQFRRSPSTHPPPSRANFQGAAYCLILLNTQADWIDAIPVAYVGDLSTLSERRFPLPSE